MTDDGGSVPNRSRSGIDDEDYLNALRELGSGTTPEVAEAVGAPDRTALYRLRRLEEDDKVQSRKVGNANLWSIADE